MTQPITVTSPLLPPLEEFIPYLEKIWENKQLTNNGPFHQQLESALADYLGVEHLCLFNNGTMALLTALQALRITGEVITTPYSFVATSHSLRWNGLTPVFVDIDPTTCNLDPEKIEQAITPQTSAIMPVHCYGIPCEVERIQQIADMYGLKVIYDAAHAFGVKLNGESILRYGDLSILSFHATKVFNTIEGGAIICPDAKTKQRIDYLKNFGFANETTVVATGINGKMNEVQAAFGLLQLQHIDKAIQERHRVTDYYRDALRDVPGIKCFSIPEQVEWNSSYFPVLVTKEYPLSRDALYQHLKNNNILTRRYFYPLISDFSMYRSVSEKYPEANHIADNILCLPVYPQLLHNEQMTICQLINKPGKSLAIF